MFIDTHCHLDFDRFDDDRDEVVSRAAQAGVQQIIVPAIEQNNIAAVLELAVIYPNVLAAVGIHPNSTAAWSDTSLEVIRAAARHAKVVAIGEIGLDYYWDAAPKAVQHTAFRLQTALAAELDLPIIIHNRDAGEDVIGILSESALVGRPRPGVLHSFSAPWPIAEAALEMGFYIGITGPVTYKKADDLRKIVAKLPLDRLLIETDAPFLAPQQRRGKRNEPAYVGYIAEKIAAIHQTDVATIGRITTENARRLFNLQRCVLEDSNV